ncbi:MAG: emp24/gp25L/p24 family/GOLD-domain-containing protein [Olpidium bornovanus]|uniref:Emp24/gp25L/p24 family/GOLD-domain-containing protein n=1 Tax=Olpidium bornovanus TaxID=278681 RepID=A0A8H7ZXG6_9FUNG|nr:MAG: emp24/gp25L/p24 family/GOLD-domain-containing protein [Olpidium bornovanus]
MRNASRDLNGYVWLKESRDQEPATRTLAAHVTVTFFEGGFFFSAARQPHSDLSRTGSSRSLVVGNRALHQSSAHFVRPANWWFEAGGSHCDGGAAESRARCRRRDAAAAAAAGVFAAAFACRERHGPHVPPRRARKGLLLCLGGPGGEEGCVLLRGASNRRVRRAAFFPAFGLVRYPLAPEPGSRNLACGRSFLLGPAPAISPAEGPFCWGREDYPEVVQRKCVYKFYWRIPRKADCRVFGKRNFYLPHHAAAFGNTSHQVQSGGSFDIDYTVADPKGRQLMSGEKERQGDYLFTGNEVGEYTFCFSNGMSTFAEKLVDFNIYVENERKPAVSDAKKVVGGPGAADEHTNNMDEILFRVSGHMSSISRKQKYFRTREHRNMATVRSTENKIFYFSLAESAIIVTVAVLQVFIVRAFFGTTKKGRAPCSASVRGRPRIGISLEPGSPGPEEIAAYCMLPQRPILLLHRFAPFGIELAKTTMMNCELIRQAECLQRRKTSAPERGEEMARQQLSAAG